MATDWVHIDTAWEMTNDLQKALDRMTEDRDQWKAKYEALLQQPCPTCVYYEGDMQ